jgi:3-oxoacyl-(acyl-carrier-protein) synthase
LAALRGVRVAQGGRSLGAADADSLFPLMRSVLSPAQPYGRDGSSSPHSMVVARGFGVPALDAEEARALAAAGLEGTVVSALKGATGYVGAATGIVEAVLAIRSLDTSLVPAIAHLDTADAGLDPRFVGRLVTGQPRRTPALAHAATVVGGWSGEWAVSAFDRPR